MWARNLDVTSRAGPGGLAKSGLGEPESGSPVAGPGLFIFVDLWMWLQLMRLQFEVVRGPVGVVWGRLGSPSRPQIHPKRPRPDLGQPQIAAT